MLLAHAVGNATHQILLQAKGATTQHLLKNVISHTAITKCGKQRMIILLLEGHSITSKEKWPVQQERKHQATALTTVLCIF